MPIEQAYKLTRNDEEILNKHCRSKRVTNED